MKSYRMRAHFNGNKWSFNEPLIRKSARDLKYQLPKHHAARQSKPRIEHDTSAQDIYFICLHVFHESYLPTENITKEKINFKIIKFKPAEKHLIWLSLHPHWSKQFLRWPPYRPVSLPNILCRWKRRSADKVHTRKRKTPEMMTITMGKTQFYC